MGEWLYNFAARSFHTNKLCSRFYSIEIEFYLKKQNIAFEPPFGGLRVTYGLRKSVEVGVFRTGVGHFKRKFQTEGGIAHEPLLVSENKSDCLFVRYQNIRSTLFGFVTDRWTDIRTDGRTDGHK